MVKERNPCPKFWPFPSMQCGGDVENRGKARMHKNERPPARRGQRIRAKKITSKVGLGLNFAVNVDFWVCHDDLNKKKLKAKT